MESESFGNKMYILSHQEEKNTIFVNMESEQWNQTNIGKDLQFGNLQLFLPFTLPFWTRKI